MDAEARQTSLIIDSVARAVANWTVDQHGTRSRDLADKYGPAWRGDWVEHTLSVVHLLAQAVAVRSQELFARSVQWTYESFQARGVDEADLITNTQCLREVLEAELPDAVKDMVTGFVTAALERLAANPSASDAAGGSNEEAVLAYLEAVLEGDNGKAQRVVLDRVEAGMSVAEAYETILAPAQARLGFMWHRGEISVADEHFGSATTQAVMARMRPHFAVAAGAGRTVMATSTPGDLHEIGLRMVADLFEIAGWNIIYLGANTPVADIIELLERRKPDLLALSVSVALTLREAGELIDAIRQADSVAGTPVLVGGPPCRLDPELWRELGADGCALSATDAVQVGNELAAR